MTTNSTTQINDFSSVLHMAIELAATSWKLGFADRLGRKTRLRSLPAGDFGKLKAEVAAAKRAFGLDADCPVVSCYEAGRDGFWVHRCLVAMDIESHIVEPASIEVNRKKRRAKTDRIDAQKIVNALMRFKAGDALACRMNRVPDPEAEDARHLNREMKTIKSERTSHTNRIKGLLAAQGISEVRIDSTLPKRLERMRTAEGRPLLPELRGRILRELTRLALAVEQIRELQMQQAQMLRAAAKEVADNLAETKSRRHAVIAEHLLQLGGIGPVTAITLATELFAWRDIKNRRQLGALVGLVPTPYSSGSDEKEQGISKSGRPELRSLMIEIAWGWLIHQPQSALSKWFCEHYGTGSKRSRKVGIVALARKLLVALGKYVRDGLVPEKAKLSGTLKFSYMPSLQLAESAS